MAVLVTISSEINYLLELPFSHLDQTSFSVVLYEMFHGLLHYDYDLSSCITLSDYFTEDEVNGKTSASLHNSSYFSVLHLNARSLSKNIDNLKLLLGGLQKSFSAISVSETWLTDLSSDEVEIPGYKFISSHRVNKSGGGTGIYLQEHFEYSLPSDCNHSDPDAIESLSVEIHNPHGKNIVVGAIYRPPNQNTSQLHFLIYLTSFLKFPEKISIVILVAIIIWTSCDIQIIPRLGIFSTVFFLIFSFH